MSETSAERQQTDEAAANAIVVDDHTVNANYANFCRISGTPEEVIIDFGVNMHPTGPSDTPIPLAQRVITNWYTAKRLLYALHVTLERHENVFGTLETDMQKRVQQR